MNGWKKGELFCQPPAAIWISRSSPPPQNHPTSESIATTRTGAEPRRRIRVTKNLERAITIRPSTEKRNFDAKKAEKFRSSKSSDETKATMAESLDLFPGWIRLPEMPLLLGGRRCSVTFCNSSTGHVFGQFTIVLSEIIPISQKLGWINFHPSKVGGKPTSPMKSLSASGTN